MACPCLFNKSLHSNPTKSLAELSVCTELMNKLPHALIIPTDNEDISWHLGWENSWVKQKLLCPS